jgi:hypothetical protein
VIVIVIITAIQRAVSNKMNSKDSWRSQFRWINRLQWTRIIHIPSTITRDIVVSTNDKKWSHGEIDRIFSTTRFIFLIFICDHHNASVILSRLVFSRLDSLFIDRDVFNSKSGRFLRYFNLVQNMILFKAGSWH